MKIAVLNSDVQLLSVKDLQKIDFGMVSDFLDRFDKAMEITSLSIFSYIPTEKWDYDQKRYLPLCSIYNIETDQVRLLALPKSVDEDITELATPEYDYEVVQLPGSDTLYKRDTYIKKKFYHSSVDFSQSTKGVLNVKIPCFFSLYSKADLENLRERDALPVWATHVYTTTTDRANSEPENSKYERIYRLATYRHVGCAIYDTTNQLVYFQPLPVPEFAEEYPERADKTRRMASDVMVFVPGDDKIVLTLEEFFN